MDSTTQTSDGDIKLNSDLFDLAEKLQIQLQKKDHKLQGKEEELAQEKQKNQKLSTDLNKEKARANKADGLKTELASAQQTILTFKMAIWKSLTSANLYYNIKVPSAGLLNGYLSADDNNGYLCSSKLSMARFKFTKNSDGTFSIYSTSKRKYLQATTNSYQSAAYFTLSASNPTKFVLFYDQQQQNKQPGILVDIYSLANGFFLSVLPVGNQNRIVANSRTAPAKKFLLVPVPVEECPVLVNLSNNNNNDVHFLFNLSVTIPILFIIYISSLFYCTWSLF